MYQTNTARLPEVDIAQDVSGVCSGSVVTGAYALPSWHWQSCTGRAALLLAKLARIYRNLLVAGWIIFAISGAKELPKIETYHKILWILGKPERFRWTAHPVLCQLCDEFPSSAIHCGMRKHANLKTLVFSPDSLSFSRHLIIALLFVPLAPWRACLWLRPATNCMKTTLLSLFNCNYILVLQYIMETKDHRTKSSCLLPSVAGLWTSDFMFGQWCWNVNTSLFFSHWNQSTPNPDLAYLHSENPHWPLVN